MTADESGRVAERWALVYLERGRLEVRDGAVVFVDDDGAALVPAARVAMLQLGPGVTATTGAVEAVADCGCTIAWVGAHGARIYASCRSGEGAERLLWQVRCRSVPRLRRKVARRLYRRRLGEAAVGSQRFRALSALEGRWMQSLYVEWARRTGVRWRGRCTEWREADAVNRALSVANSCLYGICHGAILAGGYSPAIGFIHTGNMRSFVFDVADLYKHELTVPIAFETVAEDEEGVERRVRRAFVERADKQKLMKRLIPDIQEVLHDPASGAAGA
jgi:CRISPR-associated protein Cas1